MDNPSKASILLETERVAVIFRKYNVMSYKDFEFLGKSDDTGHIPYDEFLHLMSDRKVDITDKVIIIQSDIGFDKYSDKNDCPFRNMSITVKGDIKVKGVIYSYVNHIVRMGASAGKYYKSYLHVIYDRKTQNQLGHLCVIHDQSNYGVDITDTTLIFIFH